MTGPTITVSNNADLRRAVTSLPNGGTILLAPGNYGDFRISGWRPSHTITIRSADPNNDAVFRSLNVTNSLNITFADVDISRPLNGESIYSNAVSIFGGARITLTGIDLAGSRNGNSWDDGRGILVAGADRVAILDSTISQFTLGAGFRNVTNFVFAGNSVREVNEGVQFGGARRGLVERNFITDLSPDYAAGEHPDAFQIYSSRIAASSDIAFRNNVVIEGSSGPIGGFFVRSERVDEGIMHSNLSFENNYYQGTFRHGISVNDTNGVVIDNNTVVNSAKAGLDAAITVTNVSNARITDNISPVLLQTRSTGVTIANHIDLVDRRSGAGVAVSALFAPTTAGNIDFDRLNPFAGSVAARNGAGFRNTPGIGDLTASIEAQLQDYLPRFENPLFGGVLA